MEIDGLQESLHDLTFIQNIEAAADRQAPVIHSNKIVVPYGTKLNASDFEITDNRDNLDIMDVSIKSESYEAKQLGTYSVTVSVTDTFKNTTHKEVEVQVIDNEAPVIAAREDGGYIIDVEANGSNNLLDYVKATDNVDGRRLRRRRKPPRRPTGSGCAPCLKSIYSGRTTSLSAHRSTPMRSWTRARH